METSIKEFLEQELAILNSTGFIKPEDLPNIDLYMDQITTFMDEQLSACKRYDEDKILTKTMINNYAKNNLLPPPNKKKYSREHVITMLFIYYLKYIDFDDIKYFAKHITDDVFYKKLCEGKKISKFTDDSKWDCIYDEASGFWKPGFTKIQHFSDTGETTIKCYENQLHATSFKAIAVLYDEDGISITPAEQDVEIAYGESAEVVFSDIWGMDVEDYNGTVKIYVLDQSLAPMTTAYTFADGELEEADVPTVT